MTMYTEGFIPDEKRLNPIAFCIAEPNTPWYDFDLNEIARPGHRIEDLHKWVEYNFGGFEDYCGTEIIVSYAPIKNLLKDPNEGYEPFISYEIEDFMDFYANVLKHRKTKVNSPALSVVFEKENIKKEEVMTAPASPSILNTLKNSLGTAAKQVGSVVLAEKITDLVVGRFPVRLQKAIKIVPRPVLVFAVSEAVYMAAVRFDIPGRDRVRDISKHAVDGSMYDALKLLAKLLEPLFAAIRNLAPEDLRQLIDASNTPT